MKLNLAYVTDSRSGNAPPRFQSPSSGPVRHRIRGILFAVALPKAAAKVPVVETKPSDPIGDALAVALAASPRAALSNAVEASFAERVAKKAARAKTATTAQVEQATRAAQVARAAYKHADRLSQAAVKRCVQVVQTTTAARVIAPTRTHRIVRQRVVRRASHCRTRTSRPRRVASTARATADPDSSAEPPSVAGPRESAVCS